MFLTVLGIIVAVSAAIAMLVIVARKFPQLALIDTAALPEEREAKKKKEIIHGRLARKLFLLGQRIARGAAVPWEALRNAFRRKYRRIIALDRQMREKPADPAAARKAIGTLLGEASALLVDQRFPDAEKKYVSVIALDRKNVMAYRGLGIVYIASKQFLQARDTYEFLTKMAGKSRCAYARAAAAPETGGTEVRPEDDGKCGWGPAEHAELAKDFLNLGIVLRTLQDPKASRRAFEGAVTFEPMNPKYLDLLAEACILEGVKEKAWRVFDRLKTVNPENQKLAELHRRIAEMPEPVVAEKKKRAIAK